MTELDFTKMPKWIGEARAIQMRVETWAYAYDVPREAVLRQIPIAYVWATSNPKRAPRKDVLRFLNTFMRKAKEFGNLTVAPKTRVYQEAKPPAEDVMTAEDFKKMREAL